jgi:hypothetical protein
MNPWIVALLIVFGCIILYLICYGIIQYQYQLNYTVVNVPNEKIADDIVLPPVCTDTLLEDYFMDTNYTDESIDAIRRAYKIL